MAKKKATKKKAAKKKHDKFLTKVAKYEILKPAPCCTLVVGDLFSALYSSSPAR